MLSIVTICKNFVTCTAVEEGCERNMYKFNISFDNLQICCQKVIFGELICPKGFCSNLAAEAPYAGENINYLY